MRKPILLLAVILCGFSSLADATLLVRGTDVSGNQLIYDTDLDITWYDHSNYDSWGNQVTWAAGLNVKFNGNDYTDWRLPSTADTSVGYNITGSEMGHLYYTELGNVAQASILATGPFQHLLSDFYWSGTQAIDPSYTAFGFHFDSGNNSGNQQEAHGFPAQALAVRNGDVGRSSVPEPSTLLLFAGGLAGFVAMRKSEKKTSPPRFGC